MTATTTINHNGAIVVAQAVMVGDVVFTDDDFVLYVTAVDVVTGQDGYVVLRGTDVTGDARTASYYLGDPAEILGNTR